MKIAVTGKGGVGKTTFTAILSRLYADEGRKVLAVDVDPDANLGQALGFSPEELAQIIPISQMKEMIKERTNSQDSAFSTLYTLNPKVDDLPEKYAREVNGVKLLTLGTVDVGGSGCVCLPLYFGDTIRYCADRLWFWPAGDRHGCGRPSGSGDGRRDRIYRAAGQCIDSGSQDQCLFP